MTKTDIDMSVIRCLHDFDLAWGTARINQGGGGEEGRPGTFQKQSLKNDDVRQRWLILV